MIAARTQPQYEGTLVAVIYTLDDRSSVLVFNQFGQFYNRCFGVCCFGVCLYLCNINIEYRHEYKTVQCSYNSSYPLALIIEQENEYVMKNLTK